MNLEINFSTIMSSGIFSRSCKQELGRLLYLHLYIKSREPESHSVFGGQKEGRNMELPPEVDVSTLKSNSNKLQLGGQCKPKILCEQEREIKQE